DVGSRLAIYSVTPGSKKRRFFAPDLRFQGGFCGGVEQPQRRKNCFLIFAPLVNPVTIPLFAFRLEVQKKGGGFRRYPIRFWNCGPIPKPRIFVMCSEVRDYEIIGPNSIPRMQH